MPETELRKLQIRTILTVLDTDTQTLADQIGEQRPVVSGIISGSRKATKARKKLADALCDKVTELILPKSEPENAV